MLHPFRQLVESMRSWRYSYHIPVFHGDPPKNHIDFAFSGAHYEDAGEVDSDPDNDCVWHLVYSDQLLSEDELNRCGGKRLGND